MHAATDRQAADALNAYIRFSHKANSWQRCTNSAEWQNVPVHIAQALFDQGWSMQPAEA